MKSLSLTVFCAIALFALTPTPAQAQAYTDQYGTDYQIVTDPCAGTMDVDICMWSPMGTKVDCSKIVVTSYTTCVSKCTCQYTERVQKCDGAACRDAQKADYDACLTQCMIDWV